MDPPHDTCHAAGRWSGVAIEIRSGPAVETPTECGFAVHSLNPKKLDRFCDRFSPVGAKTTAVILTRRPMPGAPTATRSGASTRLRPRSSSCASGHGLPSQSTEARPAPPSSPPVCLRRTMKSRASIRSFATSFSTKRYPTPRRKARFSSNPGNARASVPIPEGDQHGEGKRNMPERDNPEQTKQDSYMVEGLKPIETLYEQFMAAWQRGCALDQAFSEIRDQAGVEWIPNNPNSRPPDRHGKDGSWRAVEDEQHLLWKIMYVSRH